MVLEETEMNLTWIFLAAFVLAIGVVALGVIVAAYRWGRFTSLQALENSSSQTKAYLAALLPALVFAVCFRFDPALSQHAMYALVWLGAPAAFGTAICYREIRGGQSF